MKLNFEKNKAVKEKHKSELHVKQNQTQWDDKHLLPFLTQILEA